VAGLSILSTSNSATARGLRVIADRRVEADVPVEKGCSALVPIAARHLPDGMSFDAPALPGADAGTLQGAGSLTSRTPKV
jgi:hypothetical protein